MKTNKNQQHINKTNKIHIVWGAGPWHLGGSITAAMFGAAMFGCEPLEIPSSLAVVQRAGATPLELPGSRLWFLYVFCCFLFDFESFLMFFIGFCKKNVCLYKNMCGLL